MKVVLLIWYSNKNFGFRKIESYLASKFEFEIWKCPIFASSASNRLTRYKQILSVCSFGCKNALNFTCLSIKFHNRGCTNVWVRAFVTLLDFKWHHKMSLTLYLLRGALLGWNNLKESVISTVSWLMSSNFIILCILGSAFSQQKCFW